MPSPKGIFDCSIDVSKMMSKPTAFAPPSRVAVSTRPTSPVQVKKGEPSSGGVWKLSSSNATMTAGDAAGSTRAPNICQRSAVRMSSDRPWATSNKGEADKTPQATATRPIAIRSRVVRRIFTTRDLTTPSSFAAGDPPSASRPTWQAGRSGTRSCFCRRSPDKCRRGPAPCGRSRNRRTCP